MRDFLSAWEAESARVNVARAERINRGKEIAKKRFSGGRYTETILDEQERQSDGGFDTSAFMKLAHEDEWVSVKLVERPEGGQSIRSVRIMPGEERELDRVTSVLRATEAARAAAVAAVARNYR